MEKTIFRNNHFNVSFVSGIVFGVGYSDGEVVILIGPLVTTIKLYAFNRKQNKRKSIEL